MIKINCLKDIPRNKHETIQLYVDACMAHEEMMNTGSLCWFISERFYQRFKNKLFVIEETKEDGIRGVALLQIDKGKMICISHLYVKSKFRNKGVATNILKEAIDFAKSNSMNIYLNVNARNENAFKLYKRLGFIANPEQSIRMTFVGKAKKH